MGNALEAHNDIGHIRGWTCEQIKTVFNNLRRKNVIFALTKEEFAKLIGGRHREAVVVFNDLDTDYDGRVDVFEVLIVLTVWSGASWREKQGLFFEFFDMIGKGFLKIDEVILFCTLLVQTLNKFLKLDSHFKNIGMLKNYARIAFVDGEAKVGFEGFCKWIDECDPFVQLRDFMKDHSIQSQPVSLESQSRMKVTAHEKHVTWLFDQIERLQGCLPNFLSACGEYVNNCGRGKRWEFRVQALRSAILKLQQSAESMQLTLTDVNTLLVKDEQSGGMSSVLGPHQRLSQEQMLNTVENLKQQTIQDFRDATDLLHQLIELSQRNGSFDLMDTDSCIDEEEDMGRTLECSHVQEVVMRLHTDMENDLQEMEAACIKATVSTEPLPYDDDYEQSSVASPTVTQHARSMRSLDAGQAPSNSDSAAPSLVVIADFDPPEMHTSQMLKLRMGEVVTVIGQDGRGWWYGRKSDGMEGWFPPSYVQMKAACVTSASARR